jgi:hypothetical protein
MQRDPLGYVDGMGLYEYVRSGPTAAVDWWGAAAESTTSAATTEPATQPKDATPDVPLDELDKRRKVEKQIIAELEKVQERLDNMQPGSKEWHPTLRERRRLQDELGKAAVQTVRAADAASSNDRASHPDIKTFKQGDRFGVDWPLDGFWKKVAHRKLGRNECPAQISLPPALKYALDKAWILSDHSGKEAGGAISLADDGAKVWGPRVHAAHQVVLGWTAPEGTSYWGYYHTHPQDIGLKTTAFSATDLSYEWCNLAIVRVCNEVQVVIATSQAIPRALRDYDADVKGANRVERIQRAQKALSRSAPVWRFCYYRSGDDYATLRRVPKPADDDS